MELARTRRHPAQESYRDASPQFVEGKRNYGYVSPTYSSRVFQADETPKDTQDRLTSTHRASYAKGTLGEEGLSARSMTPSRQTTSDLRSSRHAPLSNQELGDEDVRSQTSRYTRSSIQKPLRNSYSNHSQSQVYPEESYHEPQFGQTIPQERFDQQVSISQDVERSVSNVSVEGSIATNEDMPVNIAFQPVPHEIFAKTQFSPHKNKIVDSRKVPAVQGYYTAEDPNDPLAVYEQDAKNQLIAIEKRLEEQEDKQNLLNEERQLLTDIMNQEERQEIQDQMKREQRKRIDNYHINVADNKFVEDKVLRANKIKARAPAIRAEADRVEAEKYREKMIEQERKAQYKQELDIIAREAKNKQEADKRSDFDAERMHRGLPIGERDRRHYDRQIMTTLKNQITEKFNFRKKLDELSKSSKIEDIVAYKDYLDAVEKQISTQNAQRKSQTFAKKTKRSAGAGETSKRLKKEQAVDKVLIHNLDEHDQNVIAFEKARKEAVKHEMRVTLEQQMKEREAKKQEEVQLKVLDRELVDPRIGANSYRPIRNYDQRLDMTLKEKIQEVQKKVEVQEDRKYIENLAKFDKLKMRDEIIYKETQKIGLAETLKEQMRHNEEKDFA